METGLSELKELFELKDRDLRTYSPLTLAYIGDGVYELVIRTILVKKGNCPVNQLHKKASSLVKAGAQSKMMELLEPDLTEEELAVYKRGRNAHSPTMAKHATMADYRRATGFEALMGYLYLKEDYSRIVELVRKGIPEENNSNDFTKAIRDRRLQMSEQIEGRNAVLEAFRSGKCVDKLFVLDRCQDGPVRTIIREARKKDTIINFVQKERLDQLSETGAHQGVIAQVAAYEYSTVEDILNKAKEKGEAPFIFLLDDIEDPHNLGAIIRTANLAGAHGVIIPKRHAAGLTSTVAKTSAGALNYTPVAKVSNLGQTIEELKKEGMWFVCADMGGDLMYNLNLTGPMGVVIGNEGEGVSRLVKEKCDFVAAIPMKGDIDSLNASVAAGILAYEVVRQRMK